MIAPIAIGCCIVAAQYLLICWLFPRPTSTVEEITLPW